MIVAIGDIHGYKDKLDDLMEKLDKHPNINFAKDVFVFLGDYIDGGSQSCQVVDVLMDYSEQYPQWQFLQGNHESLMLDALVDDNRIYGDDLTWLGQGGFATYESYLALHNLDSFQLALVTPKDVVSTTHLDWLDSLPTLVESESFYFVHGGLWPCQDVYKTPVLERMWLRGAFIQSDYDWGKRVIFGHTPQREPLVMKNKIGIDTQSYGKGYLTALLLDDDNPTYFEFVKSFEE